MADWVGLLTATLSNYQKGALDSITRQSAGFAMLQGEGRVLNSVGGANYSWRLNIRLPSVVRYEDLAPRSFVRTNNLSPELVVPWAAYDVTDALSKNDMLLNTGASQLANMLQIKIDDLAKALKQELQNAFYADGVGTAKALHGLNSWFGAGSTLSNGFFNPSDTYAGKSTALATFGGSAGTGTFPFNVSTTPQYDAHSPLIASSTSTAFGASATWAANATTILDFCRSASVRVEGPVQTVLMGREYFRDLTRMLQTRESVIINQGDKSKLAKYGWEGATCTYAGMECAEEYFCPSASAFGLNWKTFKLISNQSALFPPMEKFYSEVDKSWRLGCDFYGQMVCEGIRNQFKVAELGS